jgi:hypothetical protein
LQKLLSADFKDLNDLQFDDIHPLDRDVPNGLQDTEFAHVLPGREGLAQLMISTKGLELVSLRMACM